VVAAAGLTVLALVGACSGGDPAEESGPTTASSTTTAAPRYPVELESSACVDVATPTDRIECATLVLPEDRDRPTERQVELPVLRVAPTDGAGGAIATATATAPATGSTAPVVYLHGGPGGGAVRDWGTWLTLAEGVGRELVVYDQRGGGDATPRLDCPERDAALLGVLGGARNWTTDRDRVAAALEECATRWRAAGVDLDRYDTPTSTADLEDLRRALGTETMTLIGVSYGSRLALDYLATHPERVESLVLDGVDAPGTAGPEVEQDLPGAALDRLVASCAADEACATAHPDWEQRVAQAVERFDREPVVATLPAAADGSRAAAQILVTGDEILAGLFAAMYDSAVIPLIPSLLDQLSGGDTAVIDLIVRRHAEDLLGGAAAVAASVNCADLGPLDDEARSAARGDPGGTATLVLAGTDSFCEEWDVDPVEAEFLDAVARIEDPPPTLVVTGELDPITPAAGARRVAEALDATYLEVPRGGHAPLLSDRCARTALRSFLMDAAAPDLSCVGATAPLPFT